TSQPLVTVTREQAQQAIDNASVAIDQAEKAGKNMTYAKQLLANATNFFDQSDYADAKNYADMAYKEAANTGSPPLPQIFSNEYLIYLIIAVIILLVLIISIVALKGRSAGKDHFQELKEKWSESMKDNFQILSII